MNENGNDNDQQYGNSYGQQYDSQQYGNGYDQQAHMPEELAKYMPESWKNSLEDALAERNQNPYEHVTPRNNGAGIRPLFAIAAVAVLFAGGFSLLKLRNTFTPLILSFGAMCVLIGAGFITNKKNSAIRDKFIYWVFLIFGIEVLLPSSYQLFARFNPSLPTMGGRDIGTAIAIIVSSLGPLILIFYYLYRNNRNKFCSQEVQAVLVYVQERMSQKNNGHHPHRIYIPIYEFSFKGNIVCVAGRGRSYSNGVYVNGKPVSAPKIPEIGGRYDLMINPDDPTDFYDKKEKPAISLWVLAVVFIATGCLLLKFIYAG